MATRLRLLVIEDNPYDAELEVATLEAAGYACEWQRVETRDAFLTHLHSAEYDLILADYNLPSFDGLTALHLFLAHGLKIPFIFISGMVGEEIAIDSLKAGATDYVMKDRLSRLPLVVQRALQAQAEQRQRQQAEETLQRTERMYQQILDAITDLVLVKDSQSRILWCNKAFCDYYGMTNTQLQGMSHIPLMPLDVTQQSVRTDTHVFTTGKPLDIPEEPIIRHDGEVRLFHTVKSPIVDADGTSRMLVVVARDITERQQAEAQRQSLEAQLVQAQKMESIGTLAAGVAHDFNNLLGVILGNLALARDDLSLDEMLLRSRLADIERATERAATLTRYLLAFGRRQHLERSALNLHDLIDDLLKMLRRIIGEDVEVRLQTAADVAPVFADAGQIEQVLMNLAVNARDAMPEGGQLRVAICNAELDAAYCATHPWAKPGQYVQLTVSDTGHGMDAATCQRVFEPFFTTKEVGKGTGLGLSVVYGIIQQHDGLIHVSSEVKRGTTFTIYLPRAPHHTPLLASDTAISLRHGTEMLLVAEDEEALRLLAHAALTRLGYEVLLACDGQEAVQLYATYRERIALLILDIVMPRMGGWEAYAQIRAMDSDTPVLFVTGYSTELTRTRLGTDTHTMVLQKPYSVRELGHKVRELLDHVQRQ